MVNFVTVKASTFQVWSRKKHETQYAKAQATQPCKDPRLRLCDAAKRFDTGFLYLKSNPHNWFVLSMSKPSSKNGVVIILVLFGTLVWQHFHKTDSGPTHCLRTWMSSSVFPDAKAWHVLVVQIQAKGSTQVNFSSARLSNEHNYKEPRSNGVKHVVSLVLFSAQNALGGFQYDHAYA